MEACNVQKLILARNLSPQEKNLSDWINFARGLSLQGAVCSMFGKNAWISHLHRV
jgi:hypothetical protein